MSVNVFISHVLQDREIVEKVKHALAAEGHVPADTVFSDAQEFLSPGEDIRRRLGSKIRAADVVVLVMSKHAAESQWLNYEVGLADAFGKKIFVVGGKDTEKSTWLAKLADYQKIELESLSQ